MLPRIILLCLLYLLPIYGFAKDDAITLESILHRFTEAYGDLRDTNALSSLSVRGTILQNGQTFEFLMRKKRPHSMRYRLTSESNSVITGFDGSEGWIRTIINGEVSIDVLDDEAYRKIHYQSRFDTPLSHYIQKRENRIELIEHLILDERSVSVLEVIEYDSEATRYYLDLETAHIVQVDHLEADGEINIQTFYRDYRIVEGFPFAFEIETRVNGETRSLAKVNSIDVNPGILSVYFTKPKS